MEIKLGKKGLIKNDVQNEMNILVLYIIYF
jgi:hypothetical protein